MATMTYQVSHLVKLIDSGLNDAWIASYLNIEVEIVKNARDGMFEEIVDDQVNRSVSLSARRKLIPASRPFPQLTDEMTDGERIVVLTRHGLAARKIRKYLREPTSLRSINRYATNHLGPPRSGNRSTQAIWIPVSFMPYVHECLSRLGKDRYTCELCLEPVPKGCIVHHTKYEGATIYDLMYICGSCNLARENVGLT